MTYNVLSGTLNRAQLQLPICFVCGGAGKLCDPLLTHGPYLSTLEIGHYKVLYKFLYFIVDAGLCVCLTDVADCVSLSVVFSDSATLLSHAVCVCVCE